MICDNVNSLRVFLTKGVANRRKHFETASKWGNRHNEQSNFEPYLELLSPRRCRVLALLGRFQNLMLSKVRSCQKKTRSVFQRITGSDVKPVTRQSPNSTHSSYYVHVQSSFEYLI
jgi:hypothetical protein